MPELGTILPPSVAHASTYGDHLGPSVYTEEEDVIRNSVSERQREFRTARHCARLALAELGRTAGPLLPGDRGSVRWPKGTTGSLTHCPGFRAAAVADVRRTLTLGIDAEPHQALPSGVLRRAALPGERAMLAGLAAAEPQVHWDRLLFCAKEAVFKAWFPLTGRGLGFHATRLSFSASTRAFRAQLLVPGPAVAGRAVDGLDGLDGFDGLDGLDGFDGRWTVGHGLVVAAVAVPAVG